MGSTPAATVAVTPQDAGAEILPVGVLVPRSAAAPLRSHFGRCRRHQPSISAGEVPRWRARVRGVQRAVSAARVAATRSSQVAKRAQAVVLWRGSPGDAAGPQHPPVGLQWDLRT